MFANDKYMLSVCFSQTGIYTLLGLCTVEFTPNELKL